MTIKNFYTPRYPVKAIKYTGTIEPQGEFTEEHIASAINLRTRDLNEKGEHFTRDATPGDWIILGITGVFFMASQTWVDKNYQVDDEEPQQVNKRTISPGYRNFERVYRPLKAFQFDGTATSLPDDIEYIGPSTEGGYHWLGTRCTKKHRVSARPTEWVCFDAAGDMFVVKDHNFKGLFREVV